MRQTLLVLHGQTGPCLSEDCEEIALITMELDAVVQPDGTLRLEVPAGVRPGPVQVVLVIQPRESGLSWRQLRGLGREIWAGIDAQQYVDRLRDEWQP